MNFELLHFLMFLVKILLDGRILISVVLISWQLFKLK